jgi:hypothetical protein
LIPKITPLVEQLVEFLSASDGIVRVGIEKTVGVLGVALDFLVTPAGKATAGIVALVAAIGAGTAIASAGSLLAACGPAGAAVVALGAELAAIAIPAAIVAVAIGLVVLAIDELSTAADGGKSIIGKFAEKLGIGAEVAEILKNEFESFNVALEITKNLFEEIINLSASFASAAGNLIGKIPGLGAVGSAISSTGGVLKKGIVQGELERSRAQLQKLQQVRDISNGFNNVPNPALVGSPLDLAKLGPATLLLPSVTGFAMSRRNRVNNEFVGPTQPNVNVGVTINTSSRQEIVEEVQRAAGRAADEQLRALEDGS